jgi:hypothetical protein
MGRDSTAHETNDWASGYKSSSAQLDEASIKTEHNRKENEPVRVSPPSVVCSPLIFFLKMLLSTRNFVSISRNGSRRRPCDITLGIRARLSLQKISPQKNPHPICRAEAMVGAMTMTEATLSAIHESLVKLTVTLCHIAARQEDTLVDLRKTTAALAPSTTTMSLVMSDQASTK